jgi:hypothetical protein
VSAAQRTTRITLRRADVPDDLRAYYDEGATYSDGTVLRWCFVWLGPDGEVTHRYDPMAGHYTRGAPGLADVERAALERDAATAPGGGS